MVATRVTHGGNAGESLASAELFCPRSTKRWWGLLDADSHSQRQDSKESDGDERTRNSPLRTKHVKQWLMTDDSILSQEKWAAEHGDTGLSSQLCGVNKGGSVRVKDCPGVRSKNPLSQAGGSGQAFCLCLLGEFCRQRFCSSKAGCQPRS